MLIINWYDPACQKEADAVELLFNRFHIKEVLITKGSQGATYYTPSFRYDYPAYAVNVADTIGSGDSFLAAFLAMRLGNEPVELTLGLCGCYGCFYHFPVRRLSYPIPGLISTGLSGKRN